MPRGYNRNPYQQNPYQRQGMNQQNMYQRQNQYAQNPYMQNQYLQGQVNRQMMPPQQPMQQQMQQQMPQQMPQMPQQSPQDPMVSYEPLDEKMLNEIRAGLAKSEPTQDAPASQATTVYALDTKYIDMIGGFVQNERNASVYYKNLSEKAHNRRLSGILSKIGEASIKQIGTYQDIYKYFSGKDFEIAEAEVISNVDFYEGVRLAILEESMLLDELNDICEILPDDKSIKAINKLINRKVSLLNNLRNLQNRIDL